MNFLKSFIVNISTMAGPLEVLENFYTLFDEIVIDPKLLNLIY